MASMKMFFDPTEIIVWTQHLDTRQLKMHNWINK